MFSFGCTSSSFSTEGCSRSQMISISCTVGSFGLFKVDFVEDRRLMDGRDRRHVISISASGIFLSKEGIACFGGTSFDLLMKLSSDNFPFDLRGEMRESL